MCPLTGDYLAPTSLIIPKSFFCSHQKDLSKRSSHFTFCLQLICCLYGPTEKKFEAVKNELQASPVHISAQPSSLLIPVTLCLKCCGRESAAKAVYVPCYAHISTTFAFRCAAFGSHLLLLSLSGHPSTFLVFMSIWRCSFCDAYQ